MNATQMCIRVPGKLLAKVSDYAQKNNISKSRAAVMAMETFFDRGATSAHDKMKHLCGSGLGAKDASTSQAWRKNPPRE
jgi:hypothetical protein